MRNRFAENKVFRISVIVLAIALILAIAVTILLQRDKIASRWDFRFNSTLGVPEDVDVYMIDTDSNVGLFYDTRAPFCDDYRLKSKFSLEIHGVKVNAEYTGRATYIDGEIACAFTVENPCLENDYIVKGGYVKNGKEIARVSYIVAEFDGKTDSEKEESTAKIAEAYLGDLSEYTFAKFTTTAEEYHLYAKYIGNIRVEDYVLINFSSGSDRLVVDINTDDRNSIPNVDADEVWKYVCSKMDDYWENFKYDQGDVSRYDLPYALSLHKDKNGNLYVHGYMNVVLFLFATDETLEREFKSNYEFIVYLPE